jgi:heat shock protein 4
MATVGFDFGTSVCVVAAAQKGGIDVLMNETSSRQTPAVVGFGDKQRYVGEAAAVQVSDRSNPICLFYLSHY